MFCELNIILHKFKQFKIVSDIFAVISLRSENFGISCKEIHIYIWVWLQLDLVVSVLLPRKIQGHIMIDYHYLFTLNMPYTAGSLNLSSVIIFTENFAFLSEGILTR